MNVNGKMILFVRTIQSGDRKFNQYKGTISHKNEDGSRVNSSINVRFDSNNFKEEELIKKLNEAYCYEVEVKNGWLDTRTFTTKDGRTAHDIYIFVKEANFLKAKKVNKTDSSLDFVVEE